MIKTYFLATRPWSFPVSTMVVLATASGLFAMGFHVNWWMVVWATVGIMLFHAAENVLSDYFDYRKGVDREDTFGCITLTKKILNEQQVLRFGCILMAVAIANGLFMTWVAGAELLIYGGIGAVLALLYPWMKYHAMGDLDILLEYGIVPALGTSFFVTGQLQWEALWMVPAFVTITMGVLHANNTRDVLTDQRAHIRTMPMLVGKKASIIIYDIMIILPSIWVTGCCLAGILPYASLAVLLTLCIGIKNCRQMHRFATDDQAINNLDEKTAQLQLVNCLVLILTLIIGTLCA